MGWSGDLVGGKLVAGIRVKKENSEDMDTFLEQILYSEKVYYDVEEDLVESLIERAKKQGNLSDIQEFNRRLTEYRERTDKEIKIQISYVKKRSSYWDEEPEIAFVDKHDTWDEVWVYINLGVSVESKCAGYSSTHPLYSKEIKISDLMTSINRAKKILDEDLAQDWFETDITVFCVPYSHQVNEY